LTRNHGRNSPRRGEIPEPAERNEKDIRDVFTTPLTADEYRILVEVKYHPGASQIRGWALRDKDGRIRGWHPYESGNRNWAHADDAFRSFVPDTRQRRELVVLGCRIVATTSIQDLTDLLHVILGAAAGIGQP
jgi:hypothetical protein